MTNLATAMNDDPDDFALLLLFQRQFEKPLKGFGVVLYQHLLLLFFCLVFLMKKIRMEKKTSLVTRMWKIFFLISVFIPIFLASFKNLSSISLSCRRGRSSEAGD